jgi:tetratricopeptide (TPR) repeat protein
LHRYEDAAVPPPNGRYWDGESGEKDTRSVGYPDRDHRAMALAMVGRDQQALEILRPIAEKDELAQILIGMIEEGVLKQRVAAAPDCNLPTERSERLAGAAGGYVRYKMLDDAWPLQDAAMALNPKSPTGWANKVYMLSVDGKLKEAAEMGEKALALGIDDPYLAGNLGYVYQQLGDCNKAIPMFKRKMLGQPWTVPNYTNLAKCLDKVGRGTEAAIIWEYVQNGKPRVFWWMYVGLAVAAVGLYFLGKLALIKLLPDRFGHLNLP